MLRLTSRAMTKLTIQRLLATELVLDLATMTGSLIPDLEVLILVMNLVRRALLPLIDASRAGLDVLVRVHSGGGRGEAAALDV